MEKEQTKQNKKKEKQKLAQNSNCLVAGPIKGVVCDWLLFRRTCILNLDDTSKTYGPHEKKKQT